MYETYMKIVIAHFLRRNNKKAKERTEFVDDIKI